MKRKIKLTESNLIRIIKKVITERKKPKRKVEDTKYAKWCKEHGWEHGVGQGCADDALDSKDIQMRSWAIGFILGMKESTMDKGNKLHEQTGLYLSYDEFLEEMLQRGQNLIKLVEVIRKGNPTEMGHWDVRTQEKALGEFREVAEFTTDLINEFKVNVD